MRNLMKEVGDELGKRMDNSFNASFTINKVGPAWRLHYKDEKMIFTTAALSKENAVIQLATELGIM